MAKPNMICKQRGGGGGWGGGGGGRVRGEGGEKTREDGERENIHRKLNFQME